MLIAACTAVLYVTPTARAAVSKLNKSNIKLYLALISPELLRGFVLLLQMFDDEAALLVLFALLVLSLQMLAFQCLSGVRPAKLVACAVVVALGRATVTLLLFSRGDAARLGLLM
jgi:hypothetical protein